MKGSNRLEELVGNKPEDVAKEAVRDSKLMHEIFDGISSSNPKLKFMSAKILSLISKNDPRKLYPRIDFFIDLLDSENSILKWNAIDIIGNLVSVDVDSKFEKVFKRFCGLLQEGSLITAGHVVGNLGKIVNAKPEFENRITDELLGIHRIKLPTEECRNILIGHTILAFDKYFDKIQDKDRVIAFVERQLENSRNATKLKAEKFLKKHGSVGTP